MTACHETTEISELPRLTSQRLDQRDRRLSGILGKCFLVKEFALRNEPGASGAMLKACDCSVQSGVTVSAENMTKDPAANGRRVSRVPIAVGQIVEISRGDA